MADLELYSDAALRVDLPAQRLRRGDVVRVVERHLGPDGRAGFSIEVFSATGETLAVTAVPASALEPLRSDEVLCVRQVG
jgi:hypothetical protein